MGTAMTTRIAFVLIVVLGLCGYGFEGQVVYAEDSNDTYIVVDDMEDYNDRDDIRAVWKDGYADGSSGSNLNVSTAVGSPYQGSTGPIHGGDQAMVLRYDNDGMTYMGLPGDEKIMYPVPYFSEIDANTVGNNSLNIGQNWAAAGFKELSLWFQGHPISDGDYDANEWPGYTIYGRGRDIGGRHDEFYFLSQYPFIGDGEIQVQVYSMDNTDPCAKAGVMIREKWTPYSKYAAVFMTPGNGVVFLYRDVEDGPTTTITKPGVTVPQYLRLVRTINDMFEAQHSANGLVWEYVNAPGQAPVYPEIEMSESNLYAGTAVTSHNANQICSADFNNMVLVSPSPVNWIFGNIGTNDPERLYVSLSDGVNTSVVEHDDAGAATLTSWQEWRIPLTAFTGVDFSSIKKVYIGLGGRNNPVAGGSGTVYIDNIGLYKRRLLFVDADAPAGGDGSSWAGAFKYLQDALAAANDGDEIRVAQGTYKPDQGTGVTPGDRTATFQLINDVTVEGGYAGFGEPDPDARDVELYETILSGDLVGNDVDVNDPMDLLYEPTRVDNSYHVLTGSGTDANAILDGFTITAGHAQGNKYGGGMYNYDGSPTVLNCTFTKNWAEDNGGAMFNCSSSPLLVNCKFTFNATSEDDDDEGGSGIFNEGGSPILVDCLFIGNWADFRGGGMYNKYSYPTLTNCTFSKNWAEMGGAIYNYRDTDEEDYSPTLNNCTFSGNSADTGGAMYNWESSITLTNCTFSINLADNDGGGIYNYYSNPKVTNCIFWGNIDSGGVDESAQIHNRSGAPVINYCCVQGWTGTLGGIGNIGDDPLFVDADGIDNIVGTEDDNLRLLMGSPCIDAGDNSVVTVTTDLDGNPRIVNGTVDMGAFEFQGPFKRYYHVDGINGDNSNDGLSRETAFETIQFAIDEANDSDTILVWPGVYNEAATQGINFKGKAITVKSAADAAVLEVPGFTAVTFAQGEDGNSVFSNFVVRGSDTGILALFANPTISNVTVVDNDNGVIADNADPEITNCIFWDNFNGDLFGSPDPLEAKYSWLEGDVNEPNMPPAGLISHWKFDEGGGLIAYDSAGNNDAVVLGAIWTNSPFGNALDFDGVDDYVIVADDDSLDITDNITISSWVRPFFELNNQFIVAKWQDSEIDSSYGCRLEYSTLKFFLAKDNTKTSKAFSDLLVVTNTWNHVVVSWDGNLMRGYLNGIASSETESFAGPINVTIEPLEIGYNPGYGGGAGGAYFNGTVDEVAIYNRALSAEEVEQIYQPLANPLFADAAGDDYHLKSERGRYRATTDEWILDEVTSPCVDGGDPNVNPMNERMPNGGRINMGAYGNTAYASMSEWPIKGDVNNDGKFNFMDIAILLDGWLQELPWIQ